MYAGEGARSSPTLPQDACRDQGLPISWCVDDELAVCPTHQGVSVLAWVSPKSPFGVHTDQQISVLTLGYLLVNRKFPHLPRNIHSGLGCLPGSLAVSTLNRDILVSSQLCPHWTTPDLSPCVYTVLAYSSVSLLCSH